MSRGVFAETVECESWGAGGLQEKLLTARVAKVSRKDAKKSTKANEGQRRNEGLASVALRLA
jgi:hypothetical protein